MPSEQEIAIARWKDTYGDPMWRLRNLYKIRDKKKRLVQLKELNPIQLRLLDAIKDMKPIRLSVVKYRQGGVSTLFILKWLDDCIHHPNTITGILADLRENLGYLWEIVRIAHASMPGQYKPRIGQENTTTMTFSELNSKIMVSLGFKSTALHNLHISEHAYCDQTAVSQSLAGCSPDTNITSESTPNGPSGDAYDTYHEAKLGLNGYKPVFIPWWLQSEYQEKTIPLIRTQEESKLPITDEQLAWRRKNIQKLKREFFQFYPEDDVSCWLDASANFFNGRKVSILRNEAKTISPITETPEYTQWEEYDRDCVYAAGADVAEGYNVGGNDTPGGDGGRDYSTLCIFNTTRRTQAFRYRARVGTDTFYKVCNDWSNYYGRALLAVELNNHGHAIILGLREICHYTNLYSEKPDTRIVASRGLAMKQERFGWVTTEKSKTTALHQLREAVEGDFLEDENNFHPEFTILDDLFCNEMLTFKSEAGKLLAAEGKHDDLIMGWAIAFQMYLIIKKQERIADSIGLAIGEKRESAEQDERKARRSSQA